MRMPYIRKAEIVSHESSLLKLLGLGDNPFEHREDRVTIPFAQQPSKCCTASGYRNGKIYNHKKFIYEKCLENDMALKLQCIENQSCTHADVWLTGQVMMEACT